MISAEIKVNGVLIGYLYIHNEGYECITKNDKCTYYIEYYEPQKPIVYASCTHYRQDGATALIAKALTIVTKKIKNEIKPRKKTK